MQPIKDTKVFKWLKANTPAIATTVATVLPDKGALGIVKNMLEMAADKGEISQEQLKEITTLIHQQEIELIGQEVKDRESARAMQVAALGQDDRFSKRFIYFFAMALMLFAIIFYVGVSFFHFPAENREMVIKVETITSSVVMIVVGFFFGSAYSSRRKDDTINHLVR